MQSLLPQVSLLGTALLLSAAAALSTTAQAASGAYTFDTAKGEALYASTCAACHQATGLGIPTAFPPLKGNPAVNDADPTVQIKTILFGAQGVVIQGVDYKASAMPAFGSQLSDEDIANIVNHERSSWGNQGKAVTPDQVAAIRAKGK